MNNCAMGGENADGSPWTYYETLGGGMGAHPLGEGFSGAHVHMSNTLNTPVEALELAYPLRLTRYHLRRGSGGAGRHRGGDGIVREYEILRPTTATILSERRAIAPWGLAGGSAAAPGRNLLIDIDGSEEELSSKVTRRLRPGQRLRIETPGGGGWGWGAESSLSQPQPTPQDNERFIDARLIFGKDQWVCHEELKDVYDEWIRANLGRTSGSSNGHRAELHRQILSRDGIRHRVRGYSVYTDVRKQRQHFVGVGVRGQRGTSFRITD